MFSERFYEHQGLGEASWRKEGGWSKMILEYNI